jgi:hypothetical protein
MSERLKLSMFAVASRFAVSGAYGRPLVSPSHYAKRAQRLDRTLDNSLCMDELKACILLCIYNMTESGHWTSVVDVGKLARMAELYHASHRNIPPSERNSTYDAEEWKSIWWIIYTLDTICSAVAWV